MPETQYLQWIQVLSAYYYIYSNRFPHKYRLWSHFLLIWVYIIRL